MTDPSEPAVDATLQDRLIAAGLDILHERGLSGLTLRACAARCAVSHAAPSHHFNGLSGLLGGITTRGFEELTEFMTAAREKVNDDPRARLVAICEGYLDFALNRPALFTLMFNSGLEVEKTVESQQASNRCYAVLCDGCAAYVVPTEPVGRIETLVWSVVHGLASLRNGERLRIPDDAVRQPRIDELIDALGLVPGQSSSSRPHNT
jgi:AcrR family transcriptional regulator